MPAKLPYWIHQVVEYLLGLLLLFEGARVADHLWPALAGVAVVLLAALGDAPLSAFRSVPRPAHRWADLGVAAALVLVIVLARPGGVVVGMLGTVAGLLVLLAWRTNFLPRTVKPPLRQRLPSGRTVGRVAGRATGKAVVAGRTRWRARSRARR